MTARSLITGMTLHTKRFSATEPGVIVIICPLGRMTAAAGHHLAGARIKNILADRMTEGGVFAVTFGAGGIDRSFEHGRMVGAVRRMAIVAGIGLLMTELRRLIALEGRFMAGAADMALLPLQQPGVIAGMGGMTSHTAIITVTNQMIMRRGHLLAHFRVTLQTGIGRDRLAPGMAIATAGGIRVVQDIPD